MGNISELSIDNLIQLKPMKVPIIDVSLLNNQNHHAKDTVIDQIHQACKHSGVFHVINHGIPKELMEAAIGVNRNFFALPEDIKKDTLDSGTGDIFRPVKLLTFCNGAPGTDEVLQREVLRLHANPLEDFIDFWPKDPVDYKKSMGNYTREVRKLGAQLFEAIIESLNLPHKNHKQYFEKGLHFFCVNFYAPNPSSNIPTIKVGAPSHSDHSLITILLQSSPGLQILDMADGKWKADPKTEGSLQVFVGDHLEVLSNGVYKSVFHRVLPMREKETRISVTSFHSFEMDEIVEPAEELVGEEFPKKYKGCSAREILEHINSGDQSGRFIDFKKI